MEKNNGQEKETRGNHSRRNLVPIYIMEIMKKHTDQSHHVTQEFIARQLAEMYHYKINRKALGRYVHLLLEEELDIYGSAASGYYYTPSKCLF